MQVLEYTQLSSAYPELSLSCTSVSSTYPELGPRSLRACVTVLSSAYQELSYM